MELPAAYANASLRIALLAGEPSGDKLGAALIQSLKSKWPDACFVGIGGPGMISEGLNSLYPMERLSVMGFIEPLKRARELLKLRKTIKQLFIANPPDIFIGIDSPDFNLNLEKALKQRGIYTMHYVSPTIWAWRPGRIHKIKQAVNHMMLIFPFEKAIYDKHQCPATFVGHALASQYPVARQMSESRQALGLAQQTPMLALLVGSRESEVKRLSPLFLKTVQVLAQKNPDLRFVAAMLNQRLANLFKQACQSFPQLKIKIVIGQTKQVLQAANVAMIKSGTSTLEATLAKTPHVVVYQSSWLNFQLAKRLIKTPFISMTNILAGRQIVHEYIQDQCCPNRIANQLLTLLDGHQNEQVAKQLTDIHLSLNTNTNEVTSYLIESTLSQRNAI